MAYYTPRDHPDTCRLVYYSIRNTRTSFRITAALLQLLLLLLLIHTFSVLSLQLIEETTVTQEVSHRPIKNQSRLWSQRGTKKVNGPHHGMVTTRYSDRQGSKSRQKVRPSFMGIGFGSGILLDLVLFADRTNADPESYLSILWYIGDLQRFERRAVYIFLAFCF